MDLQEIKEYLRIDGDEEDNLLVGLQLAAEKYLENAGITKDYDNALYKLAVKLIVCHWYENREPTGNAQELAFSLRHIIAQLKHTQLATTDETEVTV